MKTLESKLGPILSTGILVFSACAVVGCADHVRGPGTKAPARSSVDSAVRGGALVSPTSTAATPNAVTPPDPIWLAAQPDLVPVLNAAHPVCATTEMVFSEIDGRNVHSFTVFAPSMAQPALEAAFRDGVGKLGYSVGPKPLDGVGFQDDRRQLGGTVSDARVSFFLVEHGGPRALCSTIGAKTGLITAGLAEVLGDAAVWRSVRFGRMGEGEISFDAELALSGGGRASLEAWAQKQKLAKITGGWLRKFDKTAPDISAVVIDVSGDGKVSITESRKGRSNEADCTPHPSRATQDHAQPSSTKSDKADKATDDRLLQEMLGH